MSAFTTAELMHSVAAPTDPHPSDAGTLLASTPPIGRYQRVRYRSTRPTPTPPRSPGA
jgi:hypothetical protein